METQESKSSQRKTDRKAQEAQEQAEINYRLKRLRELYKLDEKKEGECP
ncbi:hypothetical protein CEB3_c13400 [Peptococcaceae bacterium CEB3]|nr:hypothetical protein CEB3_c13400 [Peptococcaceae bacterium CEB3]